MNDSDALRSMWDLRYRDNDRPVVPATVLTRNAHLLPDRGTALDLACGLGGNAIFLAERGLLVSAWDLSPVAVERVRAAAETRGLQIAAEVRDIIARPPPPSSFDVIVISHFLDRGLAPAIAGALRPSGLLFYQTFAREAVTAQGPCNPEFRLDHNELLGLFAGLVVRAYRDEGRLGDLSRGVRDLAMLVAQRVE